MMPYSTYYSIVLQVEVVAKWSVLLEIVNHDELVYKLTLKYLRRDGYEIGNSDNPEIKKL